MGTQRAWLPAGFHRLVESWTRLFARGGQVADAIAIPAPVAAFSEQRQTARRWGDPVQVLLELGPPGAEAVRGWIMNRSSGGLHLCAATAWGGDHRAGPRDHRAPVHSLGRDRSQICLAVKSADDETTPRSSKIANQLMAIFAIAAPEVGPSEVK
jgi:hypothetical protein